MEVNCEGCAGCCLDWRALLEDGESAARDADGEDGDAGHRQRRAATPFDESDGERAPRTPLDDDPSFVPLTRDEVRGFLEAGMADALTPRFWHARDEGKEPRPTESSGGASPRGHAAVEIDGHALAAVAGRPAFFVGLRKPPKPVAPFGLEDPVWLPACVFLDPTTLQCRIHGSDRFPAECGAYPEHNLALEQETECERVEAAFGGERLLDADHDDPEGLLLGSQAIGAKLFCHPRPDDLEETIDRAVAGELTREDRAEAIAVAAASSPGTLAISDHHYERARTQVLAGEPAGGDDRDDGRSVDNGDDGSSWVGPAIREWTRRYRDAGGTVPSPAVADAVETDRGAPETPGWDGLE